MDLQKTIAIVEDEIIIAEDLKITLRNLGYKVIGPYTEGQSLIDSLSDNVPDLILMDIMLNGKLSGIETAEIVQKLHNIPIIYVTAYANSKILAQVKQTNPFGYIVKPFEERELHATIEIAFSRTEIENEKNRQKSLQNSLLEATLNLRSTLRYDEVIEEITLESEKLLLNTDSTLFIYNEAQNKYIHNNNSDSIENYTTSFTAKILENTINNSKTISEFDSENNQFNISIPIFIQNHIAAVLIITREKTPFDETEAAMLTTFGHHTSTVLHNAKILEELSNEIEIRKTAQNEMRKQLSFEQTIAEISSQFVLGFDLNSSIEFTLQNICDKISADKIFLIQVATIKTDIQISDKYIDIIVANSHHKEGLPNIDNNIFNSWIIKASLGEVIQIKDSLDNSKKSDDILESFQTKHIVAFPFNIKNEIGGFIVACYNQPNSIWNNKDNTLMLIASDILGNALENRLIEIEKENIKEQLYHSQKLEMIGKLAGGIAHDFNNLLTAINGYSELTLGKIDAESPIRSDLQVINDCGIKAAKLTQKLLGFSRKQIFIPISLDINTIIIDLGKMLERLIPAEIKLINQLSNEKCVIKADPNQIEQIIVNLVINAKDAIDSTGKITIKTYKKNISEEVEVFESIVEHGDYAVLEVSDNGSGIDEETLKHIFDPFFTTKKVNEGTGLGLSTVFGIIKQNNGYVDVKTEVGVGTTILIYLPFSYSQIEPSSALSEADNQKWQGTETILFIEDEINIKEFVKAILSDQGYNVLCAANGAEGLQVAKEHNYRFDLLLTDVRMPKISGPTLAKELYEQNNALKVLFISGHDYGELAKENLKGLDHKFLQKPFTISSLSKKVRETLDKE